MIRLTASKRRSMRLFCVLSVLAPSIAYTAVVGPAVAQPDCLPNYGSRFAGLTTQGNGPGGTFEGGSAHLIARFGSLCDSGSHDPNVNFNYVFTMLLSNLVATDPANAGYAQIGYYRGWGQSTYFTTEYRRNYDSFFRAIRYDYGPLNYGGDNQFWVQWVPDNGGQLRLNIDLTTMTTTPWNPYADSALGPAIHGPMRVEWTGETKYDGSDMPGTNSVRAYTYGLQVQQFNDSFSSNLPSLFGVIPGGFRYGFNRPTIHSYEIWTF